MCRDTTRFVMELLLPVLDDRGLEGWLRRPRAQYGDLTPQQLLEAGDDEAVLALAMALVHGV